MPVIDFKEIPEAHVADGNQDSFELFCQEFLKFLGMVIVSMPDRGADGGKDLLCLERRSGSCGITELRWLVSCKHKAHSGRSVTPIDEENITDRLKQHKADGFMGFYSTVVSSGLNDRLNSYKSEYNIIILNNEEIEEKLLGSPKGQLLFKRFFRKSYDIWNNNNLKPATLFSDYSPLNCSYCGTDILHPDTADKTGSILGVVRDVKYSQQHEYHKLKIVDIYYACKGNCDRILERGFEKQGYTVDWKDVDDLKIPIEYMRWIVAFFNNYQEDSLLIEPPAFEKLKTVIMSLGQYTMRELTDKENAREETLNMLPDWMR